MLADRNRYRDNQMKNNNHNRIDEQKNAEEKRFQKRKAEYLKKRRRRRQMRMFRRYLLLAGIAVGAVFLISAGVRAISRLPIFHPGPPIAEIEIPSWITQDFLTLNPYSRPQKELKQVNGVVVHYVGNPGTTAKQNQSYFNSLAETHATYASSNFIIGLEGEIIQCMPLNEVAYCSNDRNSDTISIECCHPDESGQFTQETYDSLVKLTRWLAETFSLKEEDIIRHYDVTGKICPKYYVDHPDAWAAFRKDVFAEPF